MDSDVNSKTLISVIIPTTRRPLLVQRALRGVLAQTHRNLEIIVVVDGPNPDTMSTLGAFSDPRMRVIQTDSPCGAGAARNRGAALATGAWLAFLDDDDEWLPEKLERQLAAGSGPDGWSLISCCVRVRTPEGVYNWPRQLYDSSIPVDEYLFDRRTLFRGETTFATSSIFVTREMFQKTGFGTTRQNEDTTFLLRVTKEAGGRALMLPDTLVVLYQEEARESLGSSYSWQEMLAWLDSMQQLFTKRAYSGFCLIYLGSQAAKYRNYRALPILLMRSFRSGQPRLMHVLAFLLFWVIPISLRRRARAWVKSTKALGAASGQSANNPI